MFTLRCCINLLFTYLLTRFCVSDFPDYFLSFAVFQTSTKQYAKSIILLVQRWSELFFCIRLKVGKRPFQGLYFRHFRSPYYGLRSTYWFPRLARFYFCRWLCLSVCVFVRLSVCLFVTNIASSFFVSRWNRAISWPSVLHDNNYKTLFFDFWFRPPNAQNLLPKICTKSPITRFVRQIDRRCLCLPGGFRGWPIQWNHAKCCGPTLVAMATKFALGAEIQSPTGLFI